MTLKVFFAGGRNISSLSTINLRGLFIDTEISDARSDYIKTPTCKEVNKYNKYYNN